MGRASLWWWVVAAMVAVASGCGDDDAWSGADAGLGDAGVSGDAAVVGDAAVASCEPTCGAGEACLRGVCVATCGADESTIAGWNDALAEGLVPVGNVCHAPGVALTVVGERVYEVKAVTSGTTTTFTLVRWALDPTDDAPAVETLATATHEGHAAGEIYPGAYVAVSPDEQRAIFGYTTIDAGSVGGVFDVALGTGTTVLVGANGNFEGAWLDASTYVLSGQGIEGEPSEGQGLYTHDVTASRVRRAVDEMGTYSGSVAVSGELVIAGAIAGFGTTWPDASEGSRVFVLARDEILRGTATISAWNDALARLEGPSIFTVIGGRRLVSTVYDDTFAIAGLEARALEESDGSYRLGEPEMLTSGGAFSRVIAVGEDRVLLEHGAGLLLVE